MDLREGVYVKPIGNKGDLEIIIVHSDNETIYQTNVKEEIIKLYDLDIKKFNSIILEFHNLILDLSYSKNIEEANYIFTHLDAPWQKTIKRLKKWNLLATILLTSSMHKATFNDLGALAFSTDENERYKLIKQYASHISDSFLDIGYGQDLVKKFFDSFYQNEIDFEFSHSYYKSLKVDTALCLDENNKGFTLYHFPDIESYVMYICQRFIEYDFPLCKCEYCNKYFIPKKRGVAKYCSRIDANGKTCKTLGAKAKHKENVNSDIVLKSYERTRDKLYKRLERLEISVSEYDAWFDEANKAKSDYQDGKISADEAIKIIQHE